MRIWCVVWAAMIAGCSAAPHAPNDEVGADETSGPAQLRLDANMTDAPEMLLQDCVGVSVQFNFDGETAAAAVPAPFTPVVTVNSPTGGIAAYGALAHRSCHAWLGGQDLGAVALAFGGASVRAPNGMSNQNFPVYLFRLVLDHPALVEHLVAQGLPAELGDLSDQSAWAVGYVGVSDSAMGGDRIRASVAQGDVLVPSPQRHEFFHMDGNITRWSFESSASGGDIAQSGLELDEATWGYPASANVFFSEFVYEGSMQDHAFVKFDA